MKSILLCISFCFFWFTTANALASLPTNTEVEFKEALNHVRQNFKKQDVSNTILKLESLIKKEQIDMTKYGLGRGIFQYWLSETTKISENKRIKNCQKNLTKFSKQIIHFKQSDSNQLVSYKSNATEGLSILSKQESQEIFNILRGHDDDIVYSEYGTGCESRAYAMNLIMDQMCINSAKAFIESPTIQLEDHNWSWYYHVAPIILVKIDKKITPYIIDPSIFETPVPLTKWVNKLREQHAQNKYDITLTNKYTLFPSEKDIILSGYKDKDKEEVDSRLFQRNLLRIIRPFKGSIKN